MTGQQYFETHTWAFRTMITSSTLGSSEIDAQRFMAWDDLEPDDQARWDEFARLVGAALPLAPEAASVS